MTDMNHVKRKTKKLDVLDSRVPEWDFRRFIERDCPICGAENKKDSYCRPDNCLVITCLHCGCLYVSPSPSESQLAEFYQNYHQNHFGVDFERDAKNLLLQHKRSYPADDPRLIFLKKDMNITQKREYRVLDFGCGTGAFLHQAKLFGAIVSGVELDASAVRLCHNIGLESVNYGSDDILDAIPDKFDLITLNDVIEHPLAPNVLIEKLVSLLSKTGKILIWTPNGDAVKTDKAKITLRVDLEHMQYLTSGSIRELCIRNGLEIIHYSQQGFPSESNFLGHKKSNNFKTKVKTAGVAIAKALKIEGGLRLFLSFFLAPKFKNSSLSGDYHLFAILMKRK
jgi:2-polyprenyl-3-methyl-5-hydroxy-6-metoxy-1,4-benzoquinol methylase